jgi:phosphoribosylformimino-5-aminoimidazole carboxamide ribotide isomerase
MDLYPAIDLRGGGAVRLTQGDFARETSYGDPLALARQFAADGAPWLHVVDLDAARTGAPVNRATVMTIARSVDVPVETGGGVRTIDDVAELLEGGLARVILGTAALDDPDLVHRATAAYPGQVALGLDYRRRHDGAAEVAVRGWAEGSGRTVGDLLAEVAGTDLAAVITTSIDRDGMLSGPDLDGLSAVLDSTEVPVIASGGVGSAADVVALARLAVTPRDGGPTRRLLGAITGKALVDGRMTVAEGVAACAPSE